MNIADIDARISFLTKTNTASFPAADRLIGVNKAANRAHSIALQADGRWQVDDDNQTDEAIATTALVASQQDYSITTAHLKILRVEIKLNGATYFTKLDPVDVQDVSYGIDGATTGVDNVTTGVPQWYDILGRSVFLYPIPNYSQAASLKVYYQRGPAEFTSAEVTTGTKQPGFSSLHHDLIPLWVAYDYAVANGLPQAAGWIQEIMRLEEDLKAFYGKRDKDDPARLTMRAINFR